MKKDLEQILKEIKEKYSYLRLTNIEYLELIKISCRNQNINNCIENIINSIMSNKIDKVPTFMKDKTKEEIISNYIEDYLSYSKDLNDNILQISKVYYFYELINNEEATINLNIFLFANNQKFKKIVENIRNNYDKITISNQILQLILDSYSYNYQDDTIKKDYYDITDGLSIYFNDIRNLPKISDEEKEILLLKAKQGDEIARKKFISANTRLVIAIANNYKKYCLKDFQDLVQNGNFGLMKAFDKFDQTRGVHFSTFAFYWIRKEILAYLHQKNLIRIPSCTNEKVTKVKRCQNWLNDNNIPVTPENISKNTGYSIEEVKKLLSIPLTVESLDAPINENEIEGITYGDTVSSEENLMEIVEDKIMKERFLLLITKMVNDNFIDERSKEILLSYYGFNKQRETYDELGKRFGISKQSVNQINRRTLRKIRTSHYIKEFAAFSNNPNWEKII